MTRDVADVLAPLVRAKHRILNRSLAHRYSRTRLRFRPGARPSPALELFRRVATIPGFLTYEDATHFELVLRMQRALGVRGDALEIGAYFGRSAAMIRALLPPEERLVIIDPFVAHSVGAHRPPPSRSVVESNIRSVNTHTGCARLEFIERPSTQASLGEHTRFRFVHVDGSHDHRDVVHDLQLAMKHLTPGGVIVVDDYEHWDWPGVTSAVRELLPREGLVEIGDFNRQSTVGRKLYLTRRM